jgi:soluble P-type ATPase
MSNVLGTAEYIMAAAGSLLKDKEDELDELKSLLLQVITNSEIHRSNL